MGGSSIDDDWELASPKNVLRTLVLVGLTGNGKSATGNSIIGKKAFISRACSAGVMSTCELRHTVLKDGQILNVIDTPGLFDFSSGSEFIGKEIVKCINMAKDGIHAVLVVLSVRNRFSKEEEAAISSLRTLFGSKINDYMIVVFTGGDELEENDETLEDFLGNECPEPLKETLLLCGNRRVLFDNRTKDPRKKAEQVEELLSLVNMVTTKNGGKPFTDEIFVELKKGTMELRDHTEKVNSLEGCTKQEKSELNEKMHKTYEEQMKRITEMVELKLKEATRRIEQQLAEEKAARLRAKKIAQTAQKKSNDEIRKLRKKFTDRALSPEACRARSGLAHSESLAMIELFTSYWKAAEEQEKLAKSMLARKNEELNKLEEDQAKLKEDYDKLKEEHSDLDSAYETLKLVKDAALKDKEEACGDLGKVRKELAALKEDKAKVDQDLKVATHTLKENNFTLTKQIDDLKAARQQWEVELTVAVNAAKEAAGKEAVKAYKGSDELHDYVTEKAKGFFDVGRSHMARRIVVDPSFNISIEQLAKWASEDMYNTAARQGHHLVPFNENDLVNIAQDDAEAEAEPWVPPPVELVNFNTVLAELEEPDELAFEEDTPKYTISDSRKIVYPDQQEKGLGEITAAGE